ncbi:MAG: M48 family metalloprotease [Halohasta sp.]
MYAAGAVLLALGIGPYLGFRAYARRVVATEEPVEDRLHRLKRAQQFGGVGLPIVAMVALFSLGFLDFMSEFGTSGPELFGIDVIPFAVSMLIPLGFVGVPIAGMTLGSYPAVRSLRDTSASTGRVLKRTLAGLGIVVAGAILSLGGFLAITSMFGSSTPVLVATIVVVIVGISGLTPYLTAVFNDRVPLAGDRRERIDRLCEELGYRPRGVYLLEGESVKTANAIVAGTIPGFRYVFLTDYLLTESSDDELGAIIAHEFGHIAGRHLWQRSLLTAAVFGGWMLAAEAVGFGGLEERFGFLGIFLPFMLVFLVYQFVLLGGLALWQEHRADAYAARNVGTQATVDMLELLAEANDARQDTGLVYSLLTQHPSIEKRIAAVRKRG